MLYIFGRNCILLLYTVTENYVNINALLWYHLSPAKCVSGL
jgi:hypothetical protein